MITVDLPRFLWTFCLACIAGAVYGTGAFVLVGLATVEFHNR